MNSKTLVLIDGHALAYRQYFALERTHMRTSTDKPTWAVYGFFKALFDLLNKVKPDAIAVSFDCGRETFRTREYPEYKANRQSMPDSMREQLSLLVDGINALGIPIYKKPDYEADDVIGTIAEKARLLGHHTLILTGDQDSFQLIDKDGFVKVLIPYKGELIEYDRDKVYEKMGVYPENVVDYKGLRGDTSDNIPGVKGIGEKTAVKLINEFGTVENVLANVDNITSKSIKTKLISDEEMARKSKSLAKIDKNVPIEFDFEHTCLSMPDVEVFSSYLKDMELFSFLKQLPKLLAPFNNCEVPNIDSEVLLGSNSESKPIENNQLGLFQQETADISQEIKHINSYFKSTIITDEKDFLKFVDKLKSDGIFAIDAETTGLNTFTASIVGLSFACNANITVKNNKICLKQDCNQDLELFYLPLGHIDSEQLDINMVLNILKPVFEDKKIYKILQNAKYEINLFKNYGIELNGIIFDTMIASYIKNPNYKHGLKSQALSYLKYQMTEIEELIGKGKSSITMDKVAIDKVADYACADAKATMDLAKYYDENLDDKQKDLLYNIEFPLVDVLADMEHVGISIDIPYLNKLSTEVGASIADIEKKIFEYSGEIFNINSPKQVADILFEKLKLPNRAKTKTKSGYSTSAKVLESLAHEHPIVDLLLEHRHLAKLKSTYIDSLPEMVEPKTGRIHTSFNQTITTTGRLSSSNPNLQNIPIKTELGNSIRAAFIPKDKENSVILSADYSQIELRLLAEYTKDPHLVEAFCNNKDIHADTASKIFGVSLENVTKEMRRKAKAVNFGIIYGQTSYGLATSLGIAPSEAKKIIDTYFEHYSTIRDYMQKTISFAHDNGFVTTLYGRKRDLRDELGSRNRTIREFAERAAINAPLQGTAADLIKIAMVRLHNALKESQYKAKMILQVHDELVLEVPKKEIVEIEKLVKTSMELDQPFIVPLVVDISSGSSWLEA